MTVTYVPKRNVSAGRRSLPPWPRYRVVMARNCGVNDPGLRARHRPRVPSGGRSRHDSRCPLSCHRCGPEVGPFLPTDLFHTCVWDVQKRKMFLETIR